jgi:hypothetical protein
MKSMGCFCIFCAFCSVALFLFYGYSPLILVVAIVGLVAGVRMIGKTDKS